VAGAIAALMRSEREVEVQAIGPQAVNQAVKAIAISRSYLENDRLDLYAVPSFVRLELLGEERTAVRFLVTARQLPEREAPSGVDRTAPGGGRQDETDEPD